MRVIDLLNKIANGEIPKKIYYDDMYFTYDKSCSNYVSSSGSEVDWKYTIMEYINDEVEIIEEQPKKEGFVSNNHRFVPNENGVSVFPIEEDKEIEELNLMFPIRNDIKNAELGGFVTIYSHNLSNIEYKINEIIKAVNELKKGK